MCTFFTPDNKQELEREAATPAREVEDIRNESKKSKRKHTECEEPAPSSARKEARLEAKARKLATIKTGSQQAAAVFQVQEDREVEEMKAKIRTQENEISSLCHNLEETESKIMSLEAELQELEEELAEVKIQTAAPLDLPSK